MFCCKAAAWNLNSVSNPLESDIIDHSFGNWATERFGKYDLILVSGGGGGCTRGLASVPMSASNGSHLSLPASSTSLYGGSTALEEGGRGGLALDTILNWRTLHIGSIQSQPLETFSHTRKFALPKWMLCMNKGSSSPSPSGAIFWTPKYVTHCTILKSGRLCYLLGQEMLRMNKHTYAAPNKLLDILTLFTVYCSLRITFKDRLPLLYPVWGRSFEAKHVQTNFVKFAEILFYICCLREYM